MRQGIKLSFTISADGAVCRHGMAAFLTLPLSYPVAAGLIHPNYCSKRFERLGVQSLSESICNHVFRRYISNSNLFSFNFFPDSVVLYFNMFSSSMKFRVCCKENCSPIISSKADWITWQSIS